MGGAYTLALVGFAENESATFESFFRLASRRPPAYRVQDEVMDAQILLVNADNMQALHLVQYAELPGKVLLVGNSDGGTGWPLQRKPVKLVSVLAALDALVGVAPKVAPPAPQTKARAGAVAHQPVSPRQGADRGFAATEPLVSSQMPMVPAAVPRRRTSDTEFPVTRPMVRSMMSAPPTPAPAPAAPVPVPVPARPTVPSAAMSARAARPGVMGLTDFGGLEDVPAPASRAPSSRSPAPRASRAANSPAAVAAPAPVVQRGDMLLVAESLVEGRILHKRFKKYGLSIDWSREASQALVMIKAHPYRLVAIDRLNGEPDAYQVCRNAKQRKLPNGQPPVVVMFAPSAGSMDRIKAGLAGSDAYLSRSVAEAEFYKVLAQHRLVDLDGFEKTNVGF
jgi:CheY-like chemotaxis protein